MCCKSLWICSDLLAVLLEGYVGAHSLLVVVLLEDEFSAAVSAGVNARYILGIGLKLLKHLFM